jgi:cardiolipin synthase
MRKTKTPKSQRTPATLAKRWKNYEWWERGILILGLVSFIGAVTILFLPLGKGPSEYRSSALVSAAGSRQFLDAISDQMAIPVDSGSPPEIIVDGDQFLRRILADIDSAKSSICMMNYIWSDGRFSDAVLAHLARRATSGVSVYVLLDAYGSIKAPESKFEDLKNKGGKVATFHSLMPLPWTMMRDVRRNHRRAISVDGRIGYTGGVAVDDHWLGHARNPDEWHDLMFRFTGSAAARIQGSFAEVWMATTGELLSGPWLISNQGTGSEGAPYVTISTSPSPDLFESEHFFLMSLWGARRSIHVENPYFLPDASIRKALIDKARAGLDVTLLLPGEHTDERSVRWAGQRIYDDLLAAGVKIYEYQPTFTHAKLMVEDAKWSVIGSANWDNRSRKLNDEIIVGMSDGAFASQLEDIFRSDLSRSRRVTLEDWRKRGPSQRVLEYLSQAFVQQY